MFRLIKKTFFRLLPNYPLWVETVKEISKVESRIKNLEKEIKEIKFENLLRLSEIQSIKSENKEICTKARARGSVIIFPSFVWHRVTPVTKGTRYSMVMGDLGAPWR